MTDDNLRYIAELSYDGRTCPETLVTILEALRINKKFPLFNHIWGGIGASSSRTRVFNLFKAFGKGRGFLIDYDILMSPLMQVQLASTMQIADEKGWNVVSPYFLPKTEVNNPTYPTAGRSSYFHKAENGGKVYSDEEMAKLKDWDEVELAGLGFYYGDIDPNYKFREIGTGDSEDFAFILDQNLTLHHVNLNTAHLKSAIYLKNWSQNV